MLFFQVKNVGEFWEFMEEQFLDGVHWEYWYHDGDARLVFTHSSDRIILLKLVLFIGFTTRNTGAMIYQFVRVALFV